jgi:hypothetical protein
MTVAATPIENHRYRYECDDKYGSDTALIVLADGKESSMNYGPKHGIDQALMSAILAVVGVNYVAQIPYYLHQYYLPHRTLPPLGGTTMLFATLVWFLLGWTLLMWRRSHTGYWLLLTFLLTETTFYLYNEFNQVTHGFAPFFHLQNQDPLLVVVFAIGYLNMIGGVAFVVALLWRYRRLAAQ